MGFATLTAPSWATRIFSRRFLQLADGVFDGVFAAKMLTI
jgi:hypothetical protein